MGEEGPKMKHDGPLQYEHEGVTFDFVFPKTSVEKANEFKFDYSDVLLIGYPKTGTTWLQEITWLVHNDADTEGASKAPIIERVPLMELQIPGKKPFMDIVAEQKSPRLLNSHLQYKMFEKSIEKGKPKVIVVMRNPKDSMVSYYHFYNTRQFFPKLPDFNAFFDLVKEKKVTFGDWFDHVTGWYENFGKENFLFLKYEDMKEDHYGTVEKIAKFLEKDLSPEQISTIVDYTSFASMKKKGGQAKMGDAAKSIVDENQAAFVRKGAVGDWRSTFTEEQSEYIDKLIKEKLDPLDLKFKL